MLEIESLIEESDKVFARQLVPRNSASKEDLEKLLSLVFASARLGHLCLPIDSELSALVSSLNDQLATLARQEEKGRPLVVDYEAIYLQKNWVIEERLGQQIKKLLSKPAKTPISYSGEGLSAQQKDAVEKAMGHSLSLLSGGPGTGKTFTAAHIVRSFLEHDPFSKIALAAPTGKAAMQLKASLKKLELDEIPCLTLHNLLGVKKEQDYFKEATYLDLDLLIIDESSMIDAGLFQYLLSCLGDDTRVVLMGDPFQLPSVGVGSIFSELASLAEKGFPIVCSHLRECHRCENKEMIDMAQLVKEGKDFISTLPSSWSTQENLKSIESFVINNFSFLEENLSFKDLFANLEQIRILNCLRQGPFGSDEINEKIARMLFTKTPIGSDWITPILITKSDYDIDLYNGEIGLLFHKKRSEYFPSQYFGKDDYAIFPSREQGGYRHLSLGALSFYSYGYCLSVHKSQGSEYDKVLVIAPPGSEAFGREILYTALTRAKKEINIMSSTFIIQQILEKTAKRSSRLIQRLQGNT